MYYLIYICLAIQTISTLRAAFSEDVVLLSGQECVVKPSSYTLRGGSSPSVYLSIMEKMHHKSILQSTANINSDDVMHSLQSHTGREEGLQSEIDTNNVDVTAGRNHSQVADGFPPKSSSGIALEESSKSSKAQQTEKTLMVKRIYARKRSCILQGDDDNSPRKLEKGNKRENSQTRMALCDRITLLLADTAYHNLCSSIAWTENCKHIVALGGSARLSRSRDLLLLYIPMPTRYAVILFDNQALHKSLKAVEGFIKHQCQKASAATFIKHINTALKSAFGLTQAESVCAFPLTIELQSISEPTHTLTLYSQMDQAYTETSPFILTQSVSLNRIIWERTAEDKSTLMLPKVLSIPLCAQGYAFGALCTKLEEFTAESKTPLPSFMALCIASLVDNVLPSPKVTSDFSQDILNPILRGSSIQRKKDVMPYTDFELLNAKTVLDALKSYQSAKSNFNASHRSRIALIHIKFNDTQGVFLVRSDANFPSIWNHLNQRVSEASIANVHSYLLELLQAVTNESEVSINFKNTTNQMVCHKTPLTLKLRPDLCVLVPDTETSWITRNTNIPTDSTWLEIEGLSDNLKDPKVWDKVVKLPHETCLILYEKGLSGEKNLHYTPNLHTKLGCAQ